MKKFILLAAVAALLSPVLRASAPAAISTETQGKRSVTVTALTPNIIKVTNLGKGETEPASQTLLTPAFDGETGTVTAVGQTELLTTPTGVMVTLDKNSGEVTIKGGKGRGLYDSGERSTDPQGRRTMKLLPIETTGVLLGGGERGHSLNLAGDTLVMYNRQNYGYTDTDPRIKQMNITMPLVVSPNGYALVMDDFAAAEMLTGTPLEYASESPSPVSYYFVNSPEGLAGLPAELSQIIGRQDLAPFWSLGYITSKYGYKDAAETLGTIKTLKKKGYPVDGIVLDLYWYGCEQDMGRLDWEPAQWGDHRKMLSDLKKDGVNLVAISQPYVLRNGKGLDNYNTLSDAGMLAKDFNGNTREVQIWVGEGGMFDVSNPNTRAWLRDRYKTLTDGGITGWWGDLGEPERHPDSIMHANGLTTRQYHNLYGNDWSRIIYDLFREEYPDTRLMTLMRGGTVGLQRYSVFPWSTDVSRSWGGLQPQVKIMLNSGLSGLGYMSHDVGGFAIDEARPRDTELYIRWLQMGLFSPILRTHSQQEAEPYNYPEIENILLPLIKARYSWLPYNYTLAYENATTGMPLVRPIGMYSSDPAAYTDVTDQYLWGKDVMIAPVIEEGARSREVRIPEGIWINYNDPKQVVKGDRTITVDAPLEVLPMFVRAGALIPSANYRMENTGDYNPAVYTVNYYPVEDAKAAGLCPRCATKIARSSFTLFEDNRQSPTSIADNRFALIEFNADNGADAMTLTARIEGSYDGMPSKRTIAFKIFNVAKPAGIEANGAKAKQSYDAASRVLTVTLSGWNGKEPLELKIKK